MSASRLVTLLAFPGWLVGINYHPAEGYTCWVVTPELTVLNDGESYGDAQTALRVGCDLVRQSLW